MLVDRFWAKVEVDGRTGCWEWVGCRCPHGYGIIGIGKKNKRVHRVSYELHRGSIPEGLNVLHQCDNPPCANPDHLFLGTQTDNNRDKVAKGRQNASRGTAHYMAKLTDADVRAIRAASGVSMRKLGKQYNVGHGTISRIKAGLDWAHVDA